jgi:hypothetical protein
MPWFLLRQGITILLQTTIALSHTETMVDEWLIGYFTNLHHCEYLSFYYINKFFNIVQRNTSRIFSKSRNNPQMRCVGEHLVICVL